GFGPKPVRRATSAYNTGLPRSLAIANHITGNNMREGTPRPLIRRKDYTPYPWKLQKLALDFSIGSQVTTVTSEMHFRSSVSGRGPHEISLDGQQLELVGISLDGRELQDGELSCDENHQKIHAAHEEDADRPGA